MLISFGSGNRVKTPSASPLSEGIHVLQEGSTGSDQVPLVSSGVVAVGKVRSTRGIGPRRTYPTEASMALSARGTVGTPGVGREAVLDEGLS
jgi:hypothetical protein